LLNGSKNRTPENNNMFTLSSYDFMVHACKLPQNENDIVYI